MAFDVPMIGAHRTVFVQPLIVGPHRGCPRPRSAPGFRWIRQLSLDTLDLIDEICKTLTRSYVSLFVPDTDFVRSITGISSGL